MIGRARVSLPATGLARELAEELDGHAALEALPADAWVVVSRAGTASHLDPELDHFRTIWIDRPLLEIAEAASRIAARPRLDLVAHVRELIEGDPDGYVERRLRSALDALLRWEGL